MSEKSDRFEDSDGSSQLQALEPLDLKKCNSVSDVIDGFSRCSFGARMLGEVAGTLTERAVSGDPMLVVYDGRPDGVTAGLLKTMVQEGLLSGIQSAQEYEAEGKRKDVVVVGRLSERYDQMIFHATDRAIFINNESYAKPGQIRDGYFPDAAFGDPRIMLSILRATLNDRVHAQKTSVSDLIDGFEHAHGIASDVYKGARTFKAMVEDKDCQVFLTLSGAMTVAQMYHVIDDMIADDMVQSVTSTGALMAHGLMPGMGLKHYKHNPLHNDILLARRKLNRVTDTLEPETNFDHAAAVIDAVLNELPDGASIGTAEFHSLIGKYLLDTHPHQRGILKTAYEKKIPVFVPAFVDSELGNDVYTHNLERRMAGLQEVDVNPRHDQQTLVDLAKNAQKMGIFSVGGGVPRNHIQNIAPLMEIANSRVPEAGLPERMFSYGTRIAPDALHTGNLSGCTYNENTSWRKFTFDAQTAEIQADATVIWPLLVKYVMERRSA